MTVERVWAITLALAAFFIISTGWMQHSAARIEPILAQPSPLTATVTDDRDQTLPTRVDDWSEPRVDLNGNEIDDAVSDYRVDGRGDMYERHAPDTALIHLSAPEL
jgi:hypothetical protein